MTQPSEPLINLFEVEVDGVKRHVVCFLDPERAEAEGIDAHAIIGEFTPTPDDGFDPSTFELNPAFIEAFTLYMNSIAAAAPTMVQETLTERSDWLDIIDSRHTDDPNVEPPPGDVLGCFALDETGQIVPDSFQYNTHHLWFDPVTGISGILFDRRFYDWLHPEPGLKT